MANKEPKVKVQNLTKKFGDLLVLNNLNFEVEEGEFLCIVGPTGCGKTTFLNSLTRLYEPTAGEILVNGIPVDPKKQNISYIFQEYSSFPWLTVEQNIIFPVLLDYQKPNKKYLEELLTVLNLKERRDHLPSQLSGGQQQRVAIGRALITRPSLILADEPTGNLDTQNTSEVISLLKDASKKYEQTIIMITHSRSIAQTADRVLQVSDGVLTDFGRCRE